MHPSEDKKRRKEVVLVCSLHSNGPDISDDDPVISDDDPVISDDDPVRVKFLVRGKRY